MTKDMNNALGDNSDLGRAFDDVDILGLDEFGDPSGMGALWGAMVGAGAGTVAAIGVRSMKPELGGYSELIGLGVGVAAGGAMMVSPKTRHAGVTAIAAAVLSNGLRAAEFYFKGLMVKPLVGSKANANGNWYPASYAGEAQKGGLFGPGYSVENMPRNGMGLGMQQIEALNGPSNVSLLGGMPQTSTAMALKYGAVSTGLR